MNLSLVTAKVIRENENYSYKLVGKGEKYLVRHEEAGNAGDKVIEEITPFAKEPIVIEQVSLQKNTEIIGYENSEFIFKASVEFIELKDNGKEYKVKRNYFVLANSIQEALDTLKGFTEISMSDNYITSITRTKIIEVIE